MPVVRLRSGQHRDTAAQLLTQRQRSSGYRLGSTTAGTSTGQAPGQTTGSTSSDPDKRRTSAGTRSVSGAQVIRKAGGSSHDVAIWRSLSAERRAKIKRQAASGGLSVYQRVQRIQAKRKARRA